MNMTNYIGQLNGKEQNAFYCIRKMILADLQPLIMYCYGCETSVRTKRSCFIFKQFEEERHFSCDLLLIMPEGKMVDDEKKKEVQESVAHLGKLNLLVNPLDFFKQQLKVGNLFFSWVQKNATVLFEKDAAAQSLPPAIGKEYKKQAEAFYAKDPAMVTYLETKLVPMVKEEAPKSNNPQTQPLEIKITLNAGNGWYATNTNITAEGSGSIAHN
ncbi:MAG: hypothetical protein JST58_12735 [Bacteroidetes bacterium]|nr:hypothetical protein [Bacteroidota bacterium]